MCELARQADECVNCVLFTGQTAARLMANEGRKIAEGLSPAKRSEMLHLCDEVDMLTDQLGNLCKNGLVQCYIAVTAYYFLVYEPTCLLLSLSVFFFSTAQALMHQVQLIG